MKKRSLVNFAILTIFSILILGFLLMSGVQCAQSRRLKKAQPVMEKTLAEIPFDGKQVHVYLTELCAIGPRPSGSEGMTRQQKYLETYFAQFSNSIEYQRFEFPHPDQPGVRVPGANMIIRWKPERRERILFCAHYDTLPVPWLDPPGTSRPFVGAEDSAGSVAILMELAKTLPQLLDTVQTRYGVDFVLLDAEEFIFRRHTGRFCWGSEFFGRQYALQDGKREYEYTCGILLDLCTQHDVQLLKERYSVRWPDSRPIVNEVWNTARALGVREFKNQVGTEIEDDHLYLHTYGKFPVIDIIDLDYPYWHTSQDTPDKCSALSAARVGWVITEWLKEKK